MSDKRCFVRGLCLVQAMMGKGLVGRVWWFQKVVAVSASR